MNGATNSWHTEDISDTIAAIRDAVVQSGDQCLYPRRTAWTNNGTSLPEDALEREFAWRLDVRGCWKRIAPSPRKVCASA